MIGYGTARKLIGDSSWPSTDKKGSSSLYSESKQYALDNKYSFTDNTNKASIGVTNVTIGGTTYNKVGPFNWTFTGTADSVKVYTNTNKTGEISGIQYTSDGSTIGTISDVVKSGSNFYMLVPEQQSDVTIKYIVPKIQYKGAWADIWFLSGGSAQRLIIGNGGESNLSKEEELSYNINIPGKPSSGSLKIVKTDDAGNRISGVTFNVKCTACPNNLANVNKYVGIDGSGNGTYNSSAVTLTTDSNGEIVINNLEIGEYFIQETGTLSGYESTLSSATVNITQNSGEQATIVNNRLSKIVIEKVDGENTSIKLANVGFILQRVSDGLYVRQSGSNISYVSGSENATVYRTGANGKVEIGNIIAGQYKIIETVNPNAGYENVMASTTQTVNYGETKDVQIKNTPIKSGNIKIVKIDASNSSSKLSGAKFVIKNSAGLYVQQSGGNINYVSGEGSATVFTTNSSGEIYISGLEVGTYTIIEKEAPSGYNISSSSVTVTVNKDSTVTKTISNKKPESTVSSTTGQITITGLVWEDVKTGKDTQGNNLYGSEDKLLSGIGVSLTYKDLNGSTKTINTTTSNGRYTFTISYNIGLPYDDSGVNAYNTMLNNISQGTIKFTYDGLKYTTVATNMQASNGSKATESVTDRTALNGKFGEVKEGSSRSTSTATGGTISYQTGENKSIYQSTSFSRDVTASVGLSNITKTIGQKNIYAYDRYNPYKYIIGYEDKDEDGIEETPIYEGGYDRIYGNRNTTITMQNVNLGLAEREQPDLSLEEDIYSVIVKVGEAEYTYKYDGRRNFYEPQNGEDIGVKFEKIATSTYERAIYASDVEWAKQTNGEIAVDVVYKTTITNNSTNLKMDVNSIYLYFGTNYSMKEIGRSIDGIGKNIGNKITSEVQIGGYNANYQRGKVIVEKQLNPGEKTEIYTKYTVNRETIISLLDSVEGVIFRNISEIQSYATRYNTAIEGKNVGDIYAGVDKDSAPGNAVPGDISTYEDDTGQAPGFTLKAEGNREITGIVFKDNQENEELTIGNGIKDSGEETVENVKVQLIDKDGNVAKIYKNGTSENAEIITGANGEYAFEGIVPGEYTVRYTYGDNSQFTNGEKVYVADYKSTIVTSSSVRNGINTGDEFWQLGSDVPNHSVAVDDKGIREEIDKGEEITEIAANTPKLKLNIENTKETNQTIGYTTENGKIVNAKLSYKLNDFNFGIALRPKVDVKMDKKVIYAKVTLQNGQILIEGNPSDPTVQMPYTKTGLDGIVPMEIDSELMQGARLDVVYEITLTNDSKADYSIVGVDGAGNIQYNWPFYSFGTNANTAVKLSINKELVADYLDSKLIYDQDKTIEQNGGDIWTKKDSIQQLKNEGVRLYGGVDATGYSIYVTEVGILNTEDKPETPQIDNEKKLYIAANTILASTIETTMTNHVEVIKVTPSRIKTLENLSTHEIYTVGNYNPRYGTPHEQDDDKVIISITPPTGEARNYTIYIVATITALLILSGGIIGIKKILKK